VATLATVMALWDSSFSLQALSLSALLSLLQSPLPSEWVSPGPWLLPLG
jgi:hypothetical protein